MPKATCSVEGCERPHKGYGWCGLHYWRWKNHGDPLWEPLRNAGKQCPEDGCSGAVVGRGLCAKHHQRWVRYGDPTVVKTRLRGVCSEDGCGRPHYGFGLCQMHWSRLRKYGTTAARPRLVTPPLERFLTKVALAESGCWEWTAGLNGQGYGSFAVGRVNGRKKRVLAHRFAWETFRGPIPEGSEMCHSCDNPRCVNPFDEEHHLRVCTHAENQAEMGAKGRGRNQFTVNP